MPHGCCRCVQRIDDRATAFFLSCSMQTHYKRALCESAFHSWRRLPPANKKHRSRRQWIDFMLRCRALAAVFKHWQAKARRIRQLKRVFDGAAAAWDRAESDYPVHIARLRAVFDCWLEWSSTRQIQRKETLLIAKATLHRDWFLCRSSIRHWAVQVCSASLEPTSLGSNDSLLICLLLPQASRAKSFRQRSALIVASRLHGLFRAWQARFAARTTAHAEFAKRWRRLLPMRRYLQKWLWWHLHQRLSCVARMRRVFRALKVFVALHCFYVPHKFNSIRLQSWAFRKLHLGMFCARQKAVARVHSQLSVLRLGFMPLKRLVRLRSPTIRACACGVRQRLARHCLSASFSTVYCRQPTARTAWARWLAQPRLTAAMLPQAREAPLQLHRHALHAPPAASAHDALLEMRDSPLAAHVRAVCACGGFLDAQNAAARHAQTADRVGAGTA